MFDNTYKRSLAMMKSKSEKLKTNDEILLILGYGLMNYAIIKFKENGDKKSLKKHGYLIKEIENKIKIEFNPMQVLKALAIVEDFIFNKYKKNIKLNVLYCGYYIFTSVNKDEIPSIFKSYITLISDKISEYMKEYDVSDFIEFLDGLLSYLDEIKLKG
jgi:hypothetical protein